MVYNFINASGISIHQQYGEPREQFIKYWELNEFNYDEIKSLIDKLEL